MAHRWEPTAPRPKGLVTPVRLDPLGVSGPTPHQARGRFWRRTSHGFYVPADAPDLPEQRILEQSVRLPSGAAITGWAGCRLHGGNFFDGLAPDGVTELPVPFALGRHGNIRRDERIQVSYLPLAAGDIVLRHGIRVVVEARATFDAMRFADDEREATVALEMSVAAGFTSIERVRAYGEAHPDATGIAQVRQGCDWAREHARSPNEVRTRIVWEQDAGLPRPEINCPIHALDGRLLGIADLIDVEAGFVAEFDGADHRNKDRHTRDVAKDEAFRRVGIEVARITGTDLHDRKLVVDRLRSARSRALFEPPERRRWQARPLPDCAEARLVDKEVMAEVLEHVLSLPEERPDRP